MNFKEKLLAYKGEVILSLNPFEAAEKVCKALLCHGAYQNFLHKALEKKHYLEILSFWIKCMHNREHVCEEFNKVLQNCGLAKFCLPEVKLDEVTPFENLKEEVSLSNEDRERIYERITKQCTGFGRYIGHFLLPSEKYASIYRDESKVEILLDEIMKEVHENISPSWVCLKELFNFIGYGIFVQDVEKEILNTSPRSKSSPSKKKSTSCKTISHHLMSARSASEKCLSTRLTLEQLDIIFSDNLWKIVTSGYGSGKSVVARYLLKHLMNCARKKTDIYFVMFDNSSLLVKSMQEYYRELRKDCNSTYVNLICDNAEGIGKMLVEELKELSNIPGGSITFSISNMLQAIIKKTEKQNHRFHLIVDEVDGEVINATEASQLLKIFSNSKNQLKESHVLFLLRSMEKQREYISHGKPFPHNSYQRYGDCGMEVMELGRTMRTTTQVFDIINLCMEGISSPTMIPQPEMELNDYTTEAVFLSEFDQSAKQEEQLNSDAGSYVSATKSDTDASSVPIVNLKHDNPDEIDQIAKECEEKYQGSSNKMGTLYTFKKCKFRGHDIIGHQPDLIFLNLDGHEELENMDKVALLSIALTEIFDSDATIEGGKRLIVCNNIEDIGLCKSVEVLDHEKTFFYEPKTTKPLSADLFPRFETVITNYEGSRGMECSQVIVIINPNDYFKRQYFIEAISRCTDHLVLIVPYLYKKNEVVSEERETVRNMLEKLIHFKKKKLLDITSYKLDDSMDSEDRFHTKSNQDSMWNEIKINKNCEEYWELKPQNQYHSPEMTNFDDTLLSNYAQPVSVTNRTVEVVSGGKTVKFSWNHPGTKFQLEFTTEHEGSNLTVVKFLHQASTYELSMENSCLYNLKIYAVSKYGGLLSTPCGIYQLHRSKDHHSFKDSGIVEFQLIYLTEDIFTKIGEVPRLIKETLISNNIFHIVIYCSFVGYHFEQSLKFEVFETSKDIRIDETSIEAIETIIQPKFKIKIKSLVRQALSDVPVIKCSGYKFS